MKGPALDRIVPSDLGLTDRQVEVLALMMQGKSNKAICRELDLAEPTVKKHVTAILNALNVTNRTEAVIAVGTLARQTPGSAEPSSNEQSSAPRPEEPRSQEIKRHQLPDKPSIVILPFANLSSDPGQDYFTDGMTEDITIALGRVPWLFVIASGSAFAYKERAIDFRQIGAELGVRYVLRGSARKEKSRVRITVELADASHGGHVWADTIDGDLDDVFAIQDRVTAQVSAMIAPALQLIEIERARRKATENLTAYDLYLQALPKFRTTFAENKEAVRLLQKAIVLDPSYGTAYGLAARCYLFQKVFGWVHPADPCLQEGVRLARHAAETGRNDSEALWMAGHCLATLAGEVSHGISLIKKSLALNPNSANAWVSSSITHACLGDAKAAVEDSSRAQRLNPLDTNYQNQWYAISIAHFVAARYEDATDAADKALAELPAYPAGLRMKVATCGLLGRVAEGREYVERLLAVNPDSTVSWLKAFWEAPLRHNPRALEKFLEGARLAGLPEGGPA
jgi:TolB-like protein/DNA-binding CsgD family transcriptional regulator